MLGDDLAPVRRALISVSDKSGVVSFAQALSDLGIEILSTGGTASLLRQESIPVIDVSAHTGFPEMMGGRIKTLHPHIHGGILGRRGIDEATMTEAGISPIDLVVVNLYPFEQTITSPNATREEAIENIDVGGPAMIRAAAKNHEAVTVIVDSNEYSAVIAELRTNNGISSTTRGRLAAAAFAQTARYDSIISDYLLGTHTEDNPFPEILGLQFLKHSAMRYGENPHQAAALYRDPVPMSGSLTAATLIQGRALSFNNVADADTALECVNTFEDIGCVIVKHANPCGVASADNTLQAYERAFATDPTSAFGGIIAFNRALDENTATAILDRQFVEVIIAPSITLEARTRLSEKANIRVLESGPTDSRTFNHLSLRRVSGGLLVQTQDLGTIAETDLRFMTQRTANAEELRDLLFAWRVAKFVKSNAIVYAANQQTIGIGAGQMSRVYSARIAAIKAADECLDVRGAVMASDAFFPFRDSIEAAAEAGITAVIQPGGSVRDDEVIAAADKHGMAMVFTGMRHFRH